MATLIRRQDLMANEKYEPPCNIFFGICRDTVKDTKLVMGLTRSGPHMRNQRHYHANCDVGQYKIRGHDRLIIGPEDDKKIVDYSPGDFCFIPRGEIHGAMGIGEANELIFCYVGVGSIEEAGTVFIESPQQE